MFTFLYFNFPAVRHIHSRRPVDSISCLNVRMFIPVLFFWLFLQVFINSRFNFDVDLNGESTTTGRQSRQEQDVTLRVLGIGQLEMFQLFQRHRKSLIDWFVRSCTSRVTTQNCLKCSNYVVNRLMSHPAEANEVMEAVQRVTTGAGLRARSATDLSPRGWCSMTRKHNVGRFVPDNECTKEQSQVCIITEGGANPTCPASTMIASK